MKIVIIVLKQHKKLICISTSNSWSVTTCISEVCESTVFSWPKLVNIVNRIKILRKHIMSNFLICFHCCENALCNRLPSIKQQQFGSNTGLHKWLHTQGKNVGYDKLFSNLECGQQSPVAKIAMIYWCLSLNYFFEMMLVGNISGKV